MFLIIYIFIIFRLNHNVECGMESNDVLESSRINEWHVINYVIKQTKYSKFQKTKRYKIRIDKLNKKLDASSKIKIKRVNYTLFI